MAASDGVHARIMYTILYGIHYRQLTVEQALQSADCLQRTTTNKPGVGRLLRSAIDLPPPVNPTHHCCCHSRNSASEYEV